MAKHLNSPPVPKNIKRQRLAGSTFDYNSPQGAYVTQRVAEFFDLIVKIERQDIYPAENHTEWTSDSVYLGMQRVVRQMKVVTDCAERGIALLTTYNSYITEDGDQKQFLLCLVDLHRKTLRNP